MKKLKKMTLRNGSILSTTEMTALCGGEFLPFICSYEGQKCSIQVVGGVDTGYCKWVYTAPDTQKLICVPY